MFTAVDRVAVLAVVIAAIPIPLLGIGNPISHLLALAPVGIVGWLRTRAARSWSDVAKDLGLGWPSPRTAWVAIIAGGVGSAWLKGRLDSFWLHGRGGIAFYRDVLHQNGILSPGGTARWDLAAANAPVLFVLILIDGMLFCGIIQSWIARRFGLHIGVPAQAALFALPHLFASAAPDPLYGGFAYVAGLAYGYVFAAVRNHWMPATLLWLHVMVIWVILLAGAGA
jgi:hypothetical protein